MEARVSVRAAALMSLLLNCLASGTEAQRPIPPPAEITNAAEMRLKVASAINPFWASSGEPDALATIDVWVGPGGIPDSLSWPVPPFPMSALGAVVVESVWRDGRFDFTSHSEWRRWTINFTHQELLPTAQEKKTCPTVEALRSLLIGILGWQELHASPPPHPSRIDLTTARALPLQVRVPPTFARSRHCESLLSATLQSLVEYRTTNGSLVCSEKTCPDRPTNRKRVELLESELRWVPAAWTVRELGGTWDLYCFRGECRAERWRIVSVSDRAHARGHVAR
jgi:hypothetical protein